MTEIRAEEGNLVDLLRRCLRERDADAVVVLMACLSDFWTVEGSHLKVVNARRTRSRTWSPTPRSPTSWCRRCAPPCPRSPSTR